MLYILSEVSTGDDGTTEDENDDGTGSTGRKIRKKKRALNDGTPISTVSAKHNDILLLSYINLRTHKFMYTHHEFTCIVEDRRVSTRHR